MGYRLVNLMDHMADYLKEKVELDDEALRRNLMKNARTKKRIIKITKRVIENMFKPGWIINHAWKSQSCSEILDNIAVINIFIEENGLFKTIEVWAANKEGAVSEWSGKKGKIRGVVFNEKNYNDDSGLNLL